MLALAHVTNSFRFDAAASLADLAPLFGPVAERAWAGPEWDPRFLYPAAAADVEGCVFTLHRRGRQETWVNTLFDLASGRMQYVAFVPGVMVTTVSVALTAQPPRTRVQVTYQRTALAPEFNLEVEAAGKSDAASGPEWQAAVAGALLSRRA